MGLIRLRTWLTLPPGSPPLFPSQGAVMGDRAGGEEEEGEGHSTVVII